MMRKFCTHTFKALGTVIDLRICVTNKTIINDVVRDLEKAQDLYVQFEQTLSRFNTESELSRINLAGDYCLASEDLLEIAKHSLDYYRQTEYIFDPRVKKAIETIGYSGNFYSTDAKVESGKIEVSNFSNKSLAEDLLIRDDMVCFKQQMDFSGIGKGYVTDQIVRLFRSKGYNHFVVDSGGDMYCASNEDPWKVDIEGVDAARIQFCVKNKAVATSGISRRKWENEGRRVHHLINPFLPNEFRFDIKSVTCIMDCAEAADVWAKTLFLMGPKKGLQFAERNNIACAFVDYRGNVKISNDAKKYLV